MAAGVLGIIPFIQALGIGGAVLLMGLIGLIVAIASAWAGWHVLNLREQGRSLGLALAVIGGIFSLIYLLQGATFLIINLFLYGFVTYVLVTNADRFR
jgi:hypothetical protein